MALPSRTKAIGRYRMKIHNSVHYERFALRIPLPGLYPRVSREGEFSREVILICFVEKKTSVTLSGTQSFELDCGCKDLLGMLC